MRALAPCAAALLFGCAVSPAIDVEGSPAAIIDGVPVMGEEPAVVYIYNRGGLCTGTIVSPWVVLTAKHCVQNPGSSGPSSPGSFTIGIADNLRATSETFGATKVVTTPGVYYSSETRGISGALEGVDIAVITLNRATTVTPIPPFRGDPATLIGVRSLAVGFGQTPGGNAGVKYKTDTQPINVSSRTAAAGQAGGVIYTQSTICSGDSGGPLILENDEGRFVYGVASFGPIGGCVSGINGHNRIDKHFDMIDEAIGESGTCLDNGAEVCDGFDNDCDDLVDEDCLQMGDACTDDSECITLHCAETEVGRLCSRECDLLQPYVGCPPDFYCAGSGAGGCDGFCVPGGAGAKGIGESCEMDVECASLNCMDPGDGRSRCLDPCMGNSGACLADEVCAAVPGACGGCVPKEIVVGLRGLGEPCASDDECQSRSCFGELGSSYCTRDCTADADCGDGYHCRRQAETSVCVAGYRSSAGQPCVANEDCTGSLFCAARAGVRWCTSFCTSDDACEAGFECLMVSEAASVCAPSAGGVLGEGCTAAAECLSGSCQPVGEDDTSVCTQMCGPGVSCGTGFECTRTADGLNAVCVPSVAPPVKGGGGCSVGSGAAPSGAPLAALALGLLALGVLRRRGA